MNASPHTSSLNRRTFLKRFGAASLGALALEKLLLDPYAFAFPKLAINPLPVRIRGAVKSGSRGVKGVVVSDGVSAVGTKSDGTFELIASAQQPHVFMSLPSGHEIPTNATGTARFYAPIVHDKSSMNVDWNLVRSNSFDDEHGFLQLADPQTLDAADMERFHNETVSDMQSTLRSLGTKPMFAVGCGDIMFNDLKLFPRYEEAIKKIGIPGFQVLGNHDIEFAAATDEESAATFLQYFGPSYYSFNKGEIHYVVLDDVFWHGNDYIGYIEEAQYDWLKADLSFVEKGKPVVVFTHIPPYNEQHVRMNEKKPGNRSVVVNRDALFRLLEPYTTHIIVGHMHETEHLVHHGSRIHVCGAVCGAWWTGDICFDGTPNGYGVYDVKGSQLRWRYKSTGQSFDHQMRLYAKGSDPKRPDEIIANVWDATNDWKVVWYEDGERKGEMTKGRGLDPLSVKLHAGADLPVKHKWVDPITTDHLFYAKVSSSAREVIVEATDKWERVYKAKM
jgi:Icc-related predicted phosphoesterase